MDRIDIVTGTLGKAYGCVGGYIAGSKVRWDVYELQSTWLILSSEGFG